MEIKWIKRRGKTRREEKGRTEQRGEKTTEGKGGGGGIRSRQQLQSSILG